MYMYRSYIAEQEETGVRPVTLKPIFGCAQLVGNIYITLVVLVNVACVYQLTMGTIGVCMVITACVLLIYAALTYT